MPRPTLYDEPIRVNIRLEGRIHRAGKAKARSLGLRGGFSEYVSNLIKRAKRNKRS